MVLSFLPNANGSKLSITSNFPIVWTSVQGNFYGGSDFFSSQKIQNLSPQNPPPPTKTNKQTNKQTNTNQIIINSPSVTARVKISQNFDTAILAKVYLVH